MKRLKKFLLYALAIVAFWIVSDLLIYVAVNSTYVHIDTKVETSFPEITIEDSKATFVNGFVKGSIKTNTDSAISEKDVKIDLYSPRNSKMGTKYVKIENLEPSAYQEFEMWYKFTDVDYATVTVVEDIQNASEEEFISQETASYLVVGTLLLLYFILFI